MIAWHLRPAFSAFAANSVNRIAHILINGKPTEETCSMCGPRRMSHGEPCASFFGSPQHARVALWLGRGRIVECGRVRVADLDDRGLASRALQAMALKNNVV